MEAFICVSILVLLVGPASMQSHSEFQEPEKNVTEELNTTTYSSVNDGRIDIIEEDVDSLIKRLDDLARTDNKKFNAITSQIFNQSHIISRFNLAPQCGSSIADNDFVRARAILPHVFQPDYDEVVRTAFLKNPEIFSTMLKFADTVYDRKENNTLKLYDELYIRAEMNRSTNVDDFIKMYENIRRWYHTDDWKALREAVLNTIVEKCFITLTSNGNTYNSENFIPRLSTVYNINADAGRKLMSKVVGNFYDKTNSGQVIKYVCEHKNLPLRVQGFQTLFSLMTRTNNSSNPLLFYLANEIKQTLGLVPLDAATRTELQTLINRFPHSIKTAILSDKVCIQNKKSKNYLKVVKTKDSEWRVQLSPGDTAYERSKWEFRGLSIEFRGPVVRPFDNEVVTYSSLLNSYLKKNLSKRNKSNKLEIGSSDIVTSDIRWEFILAGDYLHIRGYSVILFYNYLADSEGEPIFTNIKDDFATWYIVEC